MHTRQTLLLPAVIFVRSVLVISLLATILSACSVIQPHPNSPTILPLEPSPTSLKTLQPTSTLDPLPTLIPEEESDLRFYEEGRYKRDEYCGRIFDYHKVVYSNLTIAIADNFLEPQNQQELIERVMKQYDALVDHSPVSLSQPLTIYILPDSNNGDCVSRDHLVFTDPEDIDSTKFMEDVIGGAAGIGEYWVKAGLTSLSLGEQPDNKMLRKWYQSTNDMDIAGLFFARFHKDWAAEEEQMIAYMSAASLVEYALEIENIAPDRLSDQVNNQVRTRWLSSLGVNRPVTYPYDGQFTGFTYSSSKECPLIVQADTMRFCLTRLPEQEFFDDVADVEFLINQAYHGRKALVDYILAEAPSVRHLMQPDEMITIVVKDMGNRLGYTDTYENTIYIHRNAVYYYPLHETVHTFDWNQALQNDSIWLVEGFADYIGKLLPIGPQTTKHAVYEDLSGRVWDVETSGVVDLSYWYMLLPDQRSAAKRWYVAQKGRMDSQEVVDVRLYTDAVAFATIYRDAFGGTANVPIGKVYDTLYPGRSRYWEGQEGLELSYTQAASFVAWMCDTYSINRVLDVYVNGAENGLLDGKTYEELKSAWQDDLRSKGAGILIPGQP